MNISGKRKPVLAIVVSLLLLTAVSLWLSSVFDRYQAFRTPDQKRIHALEQIQSAQGDRKFDLIVQSAIQSYEYEPYTFDVYAGPNTSVRGSVKDEEGLLTPQERIPLLEQYLHGAQPGAWLVRAAEQLAYEYDALGRQADSDRILIEAEERLAEDPEQRRTILLIRAERELLHENFEAAEKLLQREISSESSDAEHLNERADWIKSRLLFAREQPQKSVQLANKSLVGDQRQDENGFASESYAVFETYRRSVQTAVERETTVPASFSGKLIRADGTPVARAGVFLRGSVDGSFRGDKEPYHAITDPQGRFEIRHIVPGFYQLELGLDYEQLKGWNWSWNANDWIEIENGAAVERELALQPLIERESPVGGQELTGDTVEFRWSKVKGAAYYELIGMIPNQEGSGSIGTVIRDRIPANRLSLPIGELYATPGSLSWGEDGNWELTDPASRLAYMNPDARFSWDVRAYDAAGRSLASTFSYISDPDDTSESSDFYLKQRKLTKADRLLLDGSLQQAMDAYRGGVEADPNDTESLRMLTRLLYAKYQIAGDESARTELIPLLERLTATGSSPQEAQQLFDLFYEDADWAKYDQYYDLYTKLNGGSDAYNRSRHAASFLYRENTEKAIQEFENALAEDSGHRFVGLYLAAQLAAQKPAGEVVKLAQKYPELNQDGTPYLWEGLLKKIEAERSDAPEEFDRQLQNSLAALFDNRAEGDDTGPSAASGFGSIDAFIEALSKVE